eukprot:Anaeramoba_ignava/a94745_8.p1 GENE.a94745_8~~a94745_8.p1  ORF type:complete len:101 (+),score=5.94 a94745_8:270-572(+)
MILKRKRVNIKIELYLEGYLLNRDNHLLKLDNKKIIQNVIIYHIPIYPSGILKNISIQSLYCLMKRNPFRFIRKVNELINLILLNLQYILIYFLLQLNGI